jgi:serine/threonine protein kinase
MRQNANCLNENDLLLLASGVLAGASRDQAEAHIDGCRTCRMLVGVAAGPSPSDPGPQEPLGVFRPHDLVAGRYQIIRLLGRGGMGEVYEALDTTLAERVALKTIGVESPLDKQGIAHLKAELQLARRVTHPNVCRVFDVGFHETRTVTAGGEHLTIPFLTMEFLNGETLRARITRSGRIEPPAALAIAAQIAAGLDAAHAAGIVHADLKADNVILVPGEADSVRAAITDFGLARRYGAGPLSSRSQPLVGGTIGYIAPEHLDGRRPEPPGDIYSLGVVLFEMLTGQLPFPGNSPLAAAVASVNGVPPSLRDRADVPNGWDGVVRKCLNPRPERRFQTAAEVIAALQPPARPRSTKRRLLAFSGGVMLSGALAVMVLRFSRHEAPGPLPAPAKPIPTAPPRVQPPPERVAPLPSSATAPTTDPGLVSNPAAPARRRRAPAATEKGPARSGQQVIPPVPSAKLPEVEEPGDDDAIDPF